MNRLILQYRKSLFIRARLWFWGSCLLACQVGLEAYPPRSVQAPFIGGSRSAESASGPSLPVEVEDGVRIFPGLGSRSPLVWSGIPGKLCSGLPRTDFPEVIFPIKNLFGARWQALRLRLQSMSYKGTGTLRIGQGQQFVNLELPLPEITRLQSGLCQAPDQPEVSLQLEVQTKGLFGAVAPDCRFEAVTGEGWVCHLSKTGSALAGERLRSMGREVLRQWKRQPYIFSRRMAVSQQLVALLGKPVQYEELSRFCSLLSWSLPREMPLAMRLPSWRKVFCRGEPKAVAYWGQVALDLSINELVFLKKLADQSNHTQSLLIRIPGGQIQSRDLKVRLEPADGVAGRLLERALGLRARSPLPTTEAGAAGFWHPLFTGQDQNLRYLAWLMSLSQAPTAPSFHSAGLTEGSASAYLFESLMGEADFIVGNGRYKVLYLPQGEYRYRLYDLDKSTRPWETSLEGQRMSQGSITWGKSTPSPSIRTW